MMMETPSRARSAVLAMEHRLGAPLRMYRRKNALIGIIGGWSGGLICLTFVGVMLYSMLSPHVPLLIFLSRPDHLPMMLFLTSLLGILLLGVGTYSLMNWRARAWECEEGFFEIERTGSVRVALRWDQIDTLWHRIVVSGLGNRYGYEHIYSVRGLDGREVTLSYPEIWRRSESEFTRLHLPEALARIDACHEVSFHSIVVSAQGIANRPGVARRPMLPPYGFYLPEDDPPWQIPWSALVSVRVREVTIEFEVPTYMQKPLVLMLPDIANVCLLKEVVRAMSGRQVAWIERR